MVRARTVKVKSLVEAERGSINDVDLLMIKDSYGRSVDNLRLSITQRCNLRCFYCHKEGELYPTRVEMTASEMDRVVRVATSLGIRSVKLTGGEPLLRKDIVEIVSRLSHVPRLKEVAMTTNGILLRGLAKPLRDAGLARINVSLSTLDSGPYKAITGIDTLSHVLEGIVEASTVGLTPIKVNMVILKGLNDDKVDSMIDFTKENGLILQVIEFESPEPENRYYRAYHTDLDEIERSLKERSERVLIRRMQERKKYFLKGGGEVEIVRPMHNTAFCGSCSRLRVTSDGKFKPCLFRSDNVVDFLTPMRSDASDEEVKMLLLEAVRRRRPYFI